MRNIFKYSAVAFAAIIAAACQHELSDLSVAGEEAIVKFTVNAPAGMQTKADDVPVSKINRLYVEVYTDEACTELYGSEVVEGEKTGWNLEMSVLKGHTYYMLLVAGCDGYFIPVEDGSGFSTGIKMNYSAPEGSTDNGNMEEHDLFVAKTSFTSETAGGTIKLTRPLAQINIYANDLKNASSSGKITLNKQTLKVKGIAKVHDPVTGESKEIAEETEFVTTATNTDDGRIIMCYVLPEGNAEGLVDMSLALDFDYGELKGEHLEYEITNVPVQKNHRTNIFGNLYCEQAEFTFSLDTFEDANEVQLWDGTSSEEPPLIDSDQPGDTYLITSAEQLAWIRDFVNVNKNNLDGITVQLGQDIDLSGKEWEPIGYGKDVKFSGIFDGEGHTIRNFKITGRHNGAAQAALFGTVGNATIKNLIIENASVTYTPDGSDFYAAGVAGSVYDATFENIIVRNSSFEGNNKVAGIFAHEDAGTLVEVTDCHVINCTLRSIDDEDGGNVGGIAGVLSGGGNHRFSDSSVENCTIFGHNPGNTGKRSNGEFVANIGSRNSEIHIANCEIKGNTFEQAQNVTYISPYGQLVGGIREETYKETCKVYIDGLEIIANGIGLNADGEYVITSVDGFKNFRDKVNSNSDSFAADGKKFILAADIDLQNEEFIPIGIENVARFCGSFDGKDHTIKNYQITKEYFGKSQGALFASIAGKGTIENLTIDNATIKYPTEFSNSDKDFYASALAGSIYGTRTFKNITIQNSYIEGKNKVGALIAHDAECYITVDDCHAINCTLESKHTEDGGNVGGLIGYLQSWTDIISNSSVTGCTINTYNPNDEPKRSNGEFIGCLHGNNDNDEYTITNCTVSDNTFTQKLKDGTPLPYDSPYGPLIGGNRYGKGVVMIDGKIVP